MWAFVRSFAYTKVHRVVPPALSPPGTRSQPATLCAYMPTNVVQLWLEMMGPPERAARLLQPWEGDPAIVLLGQRGAEKAYASPHFRPALDAWDTHLVTRRDVVLWAKHVVTTAAIGSV